MDVLTEIEFGRMAWLVGIFPRTENYDLMLAEVFEGFNARIVKSRIESIIVPLKTRVH